MRNFDYGGGLLVGSTVILRMRVRNIVVLVFCVVEITVVVVRMRARRYGRARYTLGNTVVMARMRVWKRQSRYGNCAVRNRIILVLMRVRVWNYGNHVMRIKTTFLPVRMRTVKLR
ncbi:unnamed protein product [Coccothraustes coccothraustes]